MKGSNQGFTLLEFLIAVLVLTVGLLGLLRTVAMSVDHNLGNERRHHAAQVADELMVADKLAPFESMSTTTQMSYLKKRFRSGFAEYSVARTVTKVGSGSAATRITLSWKHKGKRFEHTISSLRSSGN